MPSCKHHNITAIIYDKRGRVLSIGKNSYIKTHPYQKELACKCGFPDRIFIHAEIQAILKCKNLENAHTIFVSRYSANGKPLNAKPCPICTEAIRLANIKIVKYTI